MADVGNKSTENGASGGTGEPKSTEGVARFSASGMLRPSAFSSSANSSSDAPQPIATLTDAPVVHNNPFATARISSSTSSISSEGRVGDADVSTTPNKFVLRPSALDKQTSTFWPVRDVSFGGGGAASTPTSSRHSTALSGSSPFRPAGTSFKLEPAKLQNPFANQSQPTVGVMSSSNDKVTSSGAGEGGREAGAAAAAEKSDLQQTSVSGAAASSVFSTVGTEAAAAAAAGASGEVSSSKNGVESSTTVGGSTTTSAPTPISSDPSPGPIVFGRNLTERVFLPTSSSSGGSGEGGGAREGGGYVFGSNCADRAVFSSSAAAASSSSTTAAAAEASKQEGTDGTSVSNNGPESSSATEAAGEVGSMRASQSLAESAALVQARQCRPELRAVEVKTGEENESNVFQFNAKLHVFDKPSQSWHERGRGLIRLNDMSSSGNRPVQSRIVMRTQGSLRVILNTFIWSGMHIDQMSSKSIQITAADAEEGIKIFLITASPNETDQMLRAITARLEQLKLISPSLHPSSSSTAAGAALATTTSQRGGSAHPAINTSCSSSNSSTSSSSGTDGGERSTTGGVSPGAVQLGKRTSSAVGGGSSAAADSCSYTEKKLRLEMERGQYSSSAGGEESNDSSALDPETEASNEGCPSSPAIQSSSSES